MEFRLEKQPTLRIKKFDSKFYPGILYNNENLETRRAHLSGTYFEKARIITPLIYRLPLTQILKILSYTSKNLGLAAIILWGPPTAPSVAAAFAKDAIRLDACEAFRVEAYHQGSQLFH